MESLDFYRNLPKKTCAQCGNEIEEQHESYLYLCEHCLGSDE